MLFITAGVKPRTMCVCLSLVLFICFTFALTAGNDLRLTDAADNNKNGRCADDRPPLCPFCSGSSMEECDAVSHVEPCKFATDTCIMTTLVSVRGVVEIVTRGCGPAPRWCPRWDAALPHAPDSSTSGGSDVVKRVQCVNEETGQVVKCTTCEEQLKTCRGFLADYGFLKTGLLAILVGFSSIVGLVYLVGVVRSALRSNSRCRDYLHNSSRTSLSSTLNFTDSPESYDNNNDSRHQTSTTMRSSSSSRSHDKIRYTLLA